MDSMTNYRRLDDIYFTTDAMRNVFSDSNRIQKQMDCEAALAKVEGALGIIPKECAAEIQAKSSIQYIDFDELRTSLVKTGHPFVALIKEYKTICKDNAGEYVHWGATTQDILDTAAVLQIKEAYALIQDSAEKLLVILANKSLEWKHLIMAGRSNGQQAIPITLGYKLAVWGFELLDDILRLESGKERFFKGQFGGAVGTLASLGTQGLEIQRLFLNELGLYRPAIAWSSSRSHYSELVSNLAIMGATLGKIGSEVYALQKNEIGELEEYQGDGSVGSSTMPHKRNPFKAMQLSTNAKLIRGYAATMLESLETEHERDPRSASVETSVLENSFSLLHASLEKGIHLIENLVVYPERMLDNLNVLHGLIFSEPIMLELGNHMGRQEAHHIVHELARESFERKVPFIDLLKNNTVVSQYMSEDRLDDIMKYENYLGESEYFAESFADKVKMYVSDK
ncbi:adenylosuccinate lyase family protein [uncultured Veillonella sp.]|uniref:class-II fumarase/aspartase family protein n=1 Tax=uncultured Veillonella sp. TaxID=159268 RepID=UPI00260D9FA1|nr:adenylosuccinate lyase family protein [uncultured Veillonella sp.]